MNFSQIINYPLRLLGLKIVKLSSLKKLQDIQSQLNIGDIEKDLVFMKIYHEVKDFTMVEIERCYALYQSVLYILRNNIQGDFVECGVWKGGSAMLMALVLKKEGLTNRNFYLYDNFAGMTEPGDYDGDIEKKSWKEMQKEDGSNSWCYSTFEETENNLKSTGYPIDKIKIVKGKVEETIPEVMSKSIALLRLDTDWYESTKHELTHLFPIVAQSGVIIIDDYGAWQGSRRAVDEYFTESVAFLNRIDSTGRLIIK